MNGELYEKIAPYYDLLHASLTEDIDFILPLADPSSGRILEVGCGTGRLLLPLARAGKRVLGVDNSQAMLDRARQRIAAERPEVQARIRLAVADVAELELGEERFGLALFSYNTFLHLPPDAVVGACRAVRRHLAPGGRLFIDVANPILVELASERSALTLEGVFAHPHSDEVLTVMAANDDVDAAAQTLRVTWIFDTSPAGGGPVQRRVARATYHYYHLHQLDLVLRESGFEMEETYGNYGREPYGEESERLLVLARAVRPR